jgi:hypothetical protein
MLQLGKVQINMTKIEKYLNNILLLCHIYERVRFTDISNFK